MNRTRIAVLVAGALVTLACGSTPKTAGGQGTADDPAAPVVPASSAAASPAQKGPWTSFADGTYEVGSKDGQVAAGKYRTTVPADSFSCYWKRLKGTSGALSDIIASDLKKPGQPVIVTIAATDAAFETEGCGTWVKG